MTQSPPERSDFNAEVTALVAQHGACAFCGSENTPPAYVLFVEGNRVIAEPKDGPRYPYGFYCQIVDGLSELEQTRRLESWVDSGEAYQEFLAMNVCRYNC